MEDNLVKEEPEPQQFFEEPAASASTSIDLPKIPEEENGIDDSGISDSKLMLYNFVSRIDVLSLISFYNFLSFAQLPTNSLPNFSKFNFSHCSLCPKLLPKRGGGGYAALFRAGWVQRKRHKNTDEYPEITMTCHRQVY